MRLTKEFNWTMGHRLPFHKGGCYTPHGHNYRCKVTVEGETDANGMVTDFSKLKDIWKGLYAIIDHCFMINENDPFVNFIMNANVELIKESKKEFNLKIVDFETTTENIAKYIFNFFSDRINSFRVRVNSVTVYESDTGCAKYYGDGLNQNQ